MPDDDKDDDYDVHKSEGFGKIADIGYHIDVYMYLRSDIGTRALLREIEPIVDINQSSELVCKALEAIPGNEGLQGGLYFTSSDCASSRSEQTPDATKAHASRCG
jgi:hypothetical protein